MRYALCLVAVLVIALMGSQNVAGVTTADMQEEDNANKTQAECVTFLSEYDSVGDAESLCQKLLQDKASCPQKLEELGVTYAERRCESIFSTKEVRAMPEEGEKNTTGADGNITESEDSPVNAATRVRACAYYVRAYTDVENPAVTCKRVLEKVDACSKELARRGVDAPEEKCEKIHSFKTASKQKIEESPGADRKKAAQKRENEFRERVRQKKKNAVKRDVSENAREHARKAYKKSKQQMNTERQRFGKVRGQLQAVKKKLARCHNDTSEKCEKVREKAVNVTKAYLVNSLELLRGHLELRKNAFEASEYVTEEQAQEFVSVIDESIEEIDLMIADVKETTTPQDVNEVKPDAVELIRKHKRIAKVQGYRIIHAGISDAMTELEVTRERLRCSIEGMIEEGLNGTDALVGKLEEYEGLIAEAEEQHTKAMDVIIEMHSDDSGNMTPGERMSTIAHVTNDIKETVRQAHTVMREIVRNIHRSGGELCETDEDDEETEYKDDDETERDDETEDDETGKQGKDGENVDEDESGAVNETAKNTTMTDSDDDDDAEESTQLNESGSENPE